MTSMNVEEATAALSAARAKSASACSDVEQAKFRADAASYAASLAEIDLWRALSDAQRMAEQKGETSRDAILDARLMDRD